MTKNIMSIAAAAAIITSGAFAFDTNKDGDILTRINTAGNYTGGAEADALLTRSLSDTVGLDRLKGDALIFPAFDMSEDEGKWQTEVVLRNNNSDAAVIGKVVVYAADDSRELVDFNIYLSANDQFRFNIAEGKIVSTDSSVAAKEYFTKDDAVMASIIEPFTLAITDPLTEDRVDQGYIIVYGMAEPIRGFLTATDKKFHSKHLELFKFYRKNMHAKRPDWDTTHITHGVYDGAAALQAPNMDATGDVNLTGVRSTALSGTVRQYNEATTERDLLLNATALANFTNDTVTPDVNGTFGSFEQIVLWAPGEYATLADRDINGTGSYNKVLVNDDSETFLIKDITYTYSNSRGDVDNKLLLTQPTKRLLVQLGYGAQYWTLADNCLTGAIAHGLQTGLGWGFQGSTLNFNENELVPGQAIDEEIPRPGTSPRTSPGEKATEAHCNELQVLVNLERDENGNVIPGHEDGFVDFNLSTGSKEGIPAIVTQMKATQVGSSARINWVYSPATK